MASILEQSAILFLKNCGYKCHYERTKSSNFTIPGRFPRQVSIALDRDSEMTVYVNMTSISDTKYPSAGIRGVSIADHYLKGHIGKNGSRGISESVARENPSLDPAKNNVYRLHVRDIESFKLLMSWYSGNEQSSQAEPPPSSPGSSNAAEQQKVRPISQEDFLLMQERKSQIGEAGEFYVIQDELRRLREECGCADPENYVKRVSIDDVGRGYDIESSYPGHERYIEAKATTTEATGFFLTRNEREVLYELGSSGWIYIVKLDSQTGQGEIKMRIQDPVRNLPDQAYTPVVWRVDVSGLK